MINENFTATVA